VEQNTQDLWWFVGLEATLFFSLPCWELTAPWAEPVSHPIRFAFSLFAAASGATLACHVGPALFAAKFGGRRHRFSWVLLLWLAAGYLAWLLSIVVALREWTSLGAIVVFLAVVTIAGLRRSWWKPVVIFGLLLGAGIVAWALATTWHGLWIRNPNFSEEPLQFDWLIVKGMLLSAAPLVVIGWRIGRIKPDFRQIWLSGLIGVWLPLVLSVTIASLAAEAGANLYWVPSLMRGFNWALLGPQGRLEPGVMTLTTWTFLLPALLCMLSLRQLVLPWTRQRKLWLVPIAVCLLICAATSVFWHYDGLYSIFATPAHQFWAGSLVILGAAAGLSCTIFRGIR